MNKRIKKLWVKALRSGKYKQGRGRLRRRSGSVVTYCCLGVLCEVAKSEGVISRYTGSDGFPIDKILKWAELPDDNPRLNRSRATVLNDSGMSFEHIADRIEKYL